MADADQASEAVLAAVLRAERSGDFLAAFDLATRGIEADPGSLALRHRAVLALARSGATRRARALLARFGLDDHADPEVAALAARLAKDEALAADGGDRARLARDAAERYAAIHARSGGHYPAVNAATMFRIAGDRARSDQLARAALAEATTAAAAGLDAYWAASSAAEAQLLLGNTVTARATLERARAENPDDHAALATTRRQLGVLVDALGVAPDLLAPLAPPAVIHYTGHRIGTRFPAALEADVGRAIAARLAALGAGYGFGALASGADILVAEALLARGAELHVVLPCGDDEFVRRSVHLGGADDPGWAARFTACLARATRVIRATPDEVAVDDELFRHASRQAMGMALLRAGHLYAPVAQLAVWDGVETGLRAGTAVDVAAWTGGGHTSIVVDPAGPAAPPREPRAPIAAATPGAEAKNPRRVRAMLFGDIKGFSRLAEAQVPTFVDVVLGAFGRVLDQVGAAIEERNTWGDGLYIVVRGTAIAARCALALQAALERLDLAGAGLPPHLALRLAGHVGPVYALADAVAGRTSHFGTHVTRTARIEPVTPEGEVFVTEAFAAELALDDPGFRCEYVGHMPAAKGFGALRMHSLRRGTTEPT